jgi:hypothetical protein
MDQWPLFRTLVNFIERTVNYEFNLGGGGQAKELNYVLSNLPN